MAWLVKLLPAPELPGVPCDAAPPSADFESESCSRSRLAPELDGAAGIGGMAPAGADGAPGSSVFGVSRAANAVPAGAAGGPGNGAVPEGSAEDDAALVATLKDDAPESIPGFAGPGLAAVAVPPAAGGTSVAVLSCGNAIAAVVRSPGLLEGRFSGILSAFFFPAFVPTPGKGVPGDIVSDVDPAPNVDPPPNMARTSASAI